MITLKLFQYRDNILGQSGKWSFAWSLAKHLLWCWVCSLHFVNTQTHYSPSTPAELCRAHSLHQPWISPYSTRFSSMDNSCANRQAAWELGSSTCNSQQHSARTGTVPAPGWCPHAPAQTHHQDKRPQALSQCLSHQLISDPQVLLNGSKHVLLPSHCSRCVLPAVSGTRSSWQSLSKDSSPAELPLLINKFVVSDTPPPSDHTPSTLFETLFSSSFSTWDRLGCFLFYPYFPPRREKDFQEELNMAEMSHPNPTNCMGPCLFLLSSNRCPKSQNCGPNNIFTHPCYHSTPLSACTPSRAHSQAWQRHRCPPPEWDCLD